MMLNGCKKRHINLGMAYTNYKKSYGMISHSWILESLELAQVPENIVQFIRKSMKNKNTKLTSCGEYLGKVDIRRGIFQGFQSVTIAICDLYDTPDPDITKSRIRVYPEKWRKFELPFVYTSLKDLCKEWA